MITPTLPLRLLTLLLSFLYFTTTVYGGDAVILCYGDSLTAGFGVDAQEAYPARLQKRLQAEGFPHRVVNAGVSGDTTAGALSRLGWAMRAKPTLAIVTLGANDGLRGQSITAMEENLEQIILRLQKAGVQILLGGMKIPPNYGKEYTTAFAEVYPRLAKKHHLPLLPFFLAGVAGEPAYTLEDGIHPNAQGYGLILETVWRGVLPLLNREAAPSFLEDQHEKP
ncbi:MAG: arylesterase [Magnetococcales bacterium]|nr:arylesterase [Magnetococcales bacterium]